MSELLVVKSGIPHVDRCPVLTRVKAYVCQQGVRSVVEHQFVNAAGVPLDLDAVLPGIDGTLSVSESETDVVDPTGDVIVRVREAGATGIPSDRKPIYEMTCTIHDSAQGLVRTTLDDGLVQRAGLFEMSWAIRDAAEAVLLVNRGLLSVEHTLFADEPFVSQSTKGPPTLQEIRMHMRDSHRNENLLLDDVEFGDEEILDAVLKPVAMWNESLPPIRHQMSTLTFPYRQQWKDAIIGQLLVTAAHRYRRNRLKAEAGGVSVDDQNKEQEYLAAGRDMLDEYRSFVLQRKMAHNVSRVAGHHGSQYDRR